MLPLSQAAKVRFRVTVRTGFSAAGVQSGFRTATAQTGFCVVLAWCSFNAFVVSCGGCSALLSKMVFVLLLSRVVLQPLRSGADIMEVDDRQVTTVFTVQPSFHHRHSTNRISRSVTIVVKR